MAFNARFPAPNFPSHNESGVTNPAKKTYGRKALDFVPPTLRYLQYTKLYMSPQEFPSVEADVLFAPFVLAPRPVFKDPFGCVCTRMMRLATNKQKSPVTQVTYMPNANRALTGAKSGEFTLWNCQTLAFETVLQAHDNPIRRMLWSHDNAWLLSTDELGYVKYWQSNMMNVKAFQAHSDAVCGLTFAPLSTKFASGSDDGSLAVWDFETTREMSRWKSIGADVKCCAWHPKTSLIACGTRDMQQPMRLYDARSSESLGTLYYHKAGVTDVRWSPFNSNWLLSSSHDALVKLFDLRTMKVLQTFRGHKKDVTCISWHPVYENMFASGGYDGSLLYWVYGFDKEVGRLDSAHEQAIWGAEWHPLGHMVITCSNDTTTRFWTRLRPGEYDANAARAGGATVAAVEADAVTGDDEGFDGGEPANAYSGLAAAQWQWPDHHHSSNRPSIATSREQMDDGENLMPLHAFNYPLSEPLPFLPRQQMLSRGRGMPPGMFPPHFNLSSVLSRFAAPLPPPAVAAGGPRFRGGAHHHPPPGGPPFAAFGRGMRHMRPSQPPQQQHSMLNWSRLQLLDRPDEADGGKEYGDGGSGDQNAEQQHRFPPPPPNALVGRNTSSREHPSPDDGEGQPPFKRAYTADGVQPMHYADNSRGDVVEGKKSDDFGGEGANHETPSVPPGGKGSLLPDPTVRNQAQDDTFRLRDADRNAVAGSRRHDEEQQHYERTNYSMRPAAQYGEEERSEYGSTPRGYSPVSGRYPSPDDFRNRPPFNARGGSRAPYGGGPIRPYRQVMRPRGGERRPPRGGGRSME